MKYAIILGEFQRFDEGTKYTIFDGLIFCRFHDAIHNLKILVILLLYP